jgi:hypothetical protein
LPVHLGGETIIWNMAPTAGGVDVQSLLVAEQIYALGMELAEKFQHAQEQLWV